MNTDALKILKYLLDVIFIYFLLATSLMIFMLINSLLPGNSFQDLGLNTESRIIFITDIPSAIVYILNLIGFIMIFGVLYYCRKTINMWYKKGFFNSKVSDYLKIAGVLTLSSITLTKLPVLVYDFLYPITAIEVFPKLIITDLSFGSESITLSIAFGLFLLILSKVITQGNTIQNENDLTI